MTQLHRTIRARLKSVEVPLFVITFLLGAYLAVGNIFDAANVPHKSTWTPWSAWFVLLLVAAVWVPIYALRPSKPGCSRAKSARHAPLPCWHGRVSRSLP
jgi:hypothetical protein